MATHSSVLAWRIPGTAGPGGLPSMGSHRIGHGWSELAAAAAAGGSVVKNASANAVRHRFDPWVRKIPWKFSSVQSLSCVRLFATPWIAACQASCPSPTPRVHSNSTPSSWWCHPAISSSVVPFSSCPQTLPASESFPISQLFSWGGQSIRVSALESVLPKNTQDWSPLEWTGWISLQSKGLSSLLQHHSSKALSLLYGPTLTSIHDHWKIHSFD